MFVSTEFDENIDITLTFIAEYKCNKTGSLAKPENKKQEEEASCLPAFKKL